MHPDRLNPDTLQRYLGLLGIPVRVPSFFALQELIRAHLTHVPFENVSKLYYGKNFRLTSLPDIDRFLDGIEKFHFGGTCYSNNFHFYSLLHTLGYRVKLCGADMSEPDIHMVSMVTVEGREYLVDAGYAAPFLSPIPRDLTTDYELMLGRDRYILKPQDAHGCSRLDLYRDGALKHGYTAKPHARNLVDFAPVIANSFRPNATFLKSLLLVRCQPNAAVMIHNLERVESRGTECQVSVLPDKRALIDEIERSFEMPRVIVSEVVNDLGALQDPWSLSTT